MNAKCALLIAPALLLLGCHSLVHNANGNVMTYHCDGGRTVRATYPDSDNAVLTIDGQTHRLHAAISADGARYVDNQWQWWTKGMHDARLAPIKAGETIASDIGATCTAP